MAASPADQVPRVVEASPPPPFFAMAQRTRGAGGGQCGECGNAPCTCVNVQVCETCQQRPCVCRQNRRCNKCGFSQCRCGGGGNGNGNGGWGRGPNDGRGRFGRNGGFGWNDGCCSPIVWVLFLIIIIVWFISYFYSGFQHTIRIVQSPVDKGDGRCITLDDGGSSLAIKGDPKFCDSQISRFVIVNVVSGVDMVCLPDQLSKCWTNVGDKLRISDVTATSTGQYFKFDMASSPYQEIALLDQQGVPNGLCVSSKQSTSTEIWSAIGADLSVNAFPCPKGDERDASTEFLVANAQWS